MTDRKQTHLPILAISMIMLAMIACGGSDKVTPTTQLPAETAVPTVVEAAERVTPIATADDFVPTYIVLGGKVVNSRTGEWPDNRLVLLFLKGKEIGRDTTSMRISLPVSNGGIIRRGQFPDSEQGIVDGVFVIVAPNPYQITLSQLNATRTAFTGIRTTQSAYPLPLTDKEAYHWFSEIEEGSTCEISILPKNIKYVLKIIEGDVALLPAEIQAPGSTALQDDGTIVVALSEAEQVHRVHRQLWRKCADLTKVYPVSDVYPRIPYQCKLRHWPGNISLLAGRCTAVAVRVRLLQRADRNQDHRIRHAG
jgi:hypothetical protein